jgi:prepilin-type processing-associated H-X9-DG protein
MLLDCGIAGALPLMTDTPPEYDGDFYPSGEGDNFDEMRRFCVNRHEGYVNCLFLDWTVRKVGLRGLWYLKWNPVWEMSDPPVWPEWMASLSDDH